MCWSTNDGSPSRRGGHETPPGMVSRCLTVLPLPLPHMVHPGTPSSPLHPSWHLRCPHKLLVKPMDEYFEDIDVVALAAASETKEAFNADDPDAYISELTLVLTTGARRMTTMMVMAACR